MIRKVAEEHHHTPDEVQEYCAKALKIMYAVGATDDLQPVVFVEAIRLLAAKQMWHEQVQPTMAIPGHKLHG